MAAVEGQTFDAVVTNPPIRAGKQVIYKMFADAAKSLNPGGALYLVIRKQQGAESCMKYLQTLFDSVEKLDKSGGFWVLKAMNNAECRIQNSELYSVYSSAFPHLHLPDQSRSFQTRYISYNHFILHSAFLILHWYKFSTDR